MLRSQMLRGLGSIAGKLAPSDYQQRRIHSSKHATNRSLPTDLQKVPLPQTLAHLGQGKLVSVFIT